MTGEDHAGSHGPALQLPFSEKTGLAELLDMAEAKYRTRFEKISIGSHELEVLQLADLEDHIDRLADSAGDGDLELPFWAKVWPTSILLSYFILKLPPSLDRTALEIGAGIGLCGLIAAKHGFSVHISDNHPDALLFARINILKNGLEGRADILPVDFTKDELKRRYPLILGSEVAYREADYPDLVRFLDRHLQTEPTAQAILARSYTRPAEAFSREAARLFAIEEKNLGYKESGTAETPSSERHLCTISRLTRLSQ